MALVWRELRASIASLYDLAALVDMGRNKEGNVGEKKTGADGMSEANISITRVGTGPESPCQWTSGVKKKVRGYGIT